MISWKECRSAIRKSLGIELEKIGFKNPGFIMYRRREKFIDVVQCYYFNNTYFTIEFGCQPKEIKIKNGFKTVNTIFRGRMWSTDKRNFTVSIKNSIEEQEEYLNGIALLVINNINIWFSNFTDIDSAIYALENNEGYINPAKDVFSGGKGSIVYNDAMRKLLEIKQNFK